MKQKDIDRAAKALLNAGKLPKRKIPKHTKEDLERKFVMRVDRNGKPLIKEVE